MTSPKIAVAIFCYNTSKQLPRVLERFTPELCSRISKIWIIDNQSKDGTPKVASETIAKLGLAEIAEVRVNPTNCGLGGSHKVALSLALLENFDYLGTVHGDDQGRANELLKFINEMDENPNYAAYLGARFLPGSNLKGYSRTRIAGNLALNFAYTVLSGRLTWDIGGGMNLFRIEDLKDKAFLKFSDGFTFNMDMLLYYYRRKSPLKFLPLTWTETDQVSNAKTFQTGWLALKTVISWRLNL